MTSPSNFVWHAGRWITPGELYGIEYGEEAADRQRPKPPSPPPTIEMLELFDRRLVTGRKPKVDELYHDALQSNGKRP